MYTDKWTDQRADRNLHALNQEDFNADLSEPKQFYILVQI